MNTNDLAVESSVWPEAQSESAWFARQVERFGSDTVKALIKDVLHLKECVSFHVACSEDISLLWQYWRDKKKKWLELAQQNPQGAFETFGWLLFFYVAHRVCVELAEVDVHHRVWGTFEVVAALVLFNVPCCYSSLSPPEFFFPFSH